MDYEKLADAEAVERTIVALRERGVEAELLERKEEVLERIKQLIPAGVSIMNGASVTLKQIGFTDYLKSDAHGWNNLHAAILDETDPAKQAELRRCGVTSDFYLGSVHAVAESGEMVIASNTGSQLPHIEYSSPNVILVVSTKKIVPSLAEALQRLEVHVVPLEDKRLMAAYNIHTRVSKLLIFKNESPSNQRKLRVLFVNENLGF